MASGVGQAYRADRRGDPTPIHSIEGHDLALHHSQWDPRSSAPSRSGQRRDAALPPRPFLNSGTIRKSRRRPLATAGSGRPRAAAPCSVLCLCGRNLPGIVTLTGSNARSRNPASDGQMRSQCLTGATVAAPKPEIGENRPNVTSPSKEDASIGFASNSCPHQRANAGC